MCECGKKTCINCDGTPESKQKVPHKQASLIKAWADGAKIQCADNIGGWYDTLNFTWDVHHHYRIKPEPKPDSFTFGKSGVFGLRWDNARVYYSNVMFTFDGETGKIKSVCLL